MSNIISECITICLSAIDIIFFYRLLNNKLSYRFPQKFLIVSHFISYILYILCATSMELFPGIPIKMPLLLLFFASLFFMYQDDFLHRILWLIVGYFSLITCELVALPIALIITGNDFGNINEQPLAQIIGMIISRSIFIAIVELIIHTKKKLFSGFIRDFLLILFVDVIYSVIISCFFYLENIYITTDTAIALSLLVMFLVSALALYLLQKITKKSEEIMTTNLKLQQIEMEHKQNQDMTIVVEDLRTLRHDMNNHMSVLQGLLSMGEYQDAKDYLSTITSELDVANSFVFTDNKVLSVLMNHKASKTRQAGITFDTEIMTSVTPFSDSDLCALLGNILENAIEACAGHEKPYIFFSIKKENGRLLITCDNTFTIPPVFEKGSLVTTKADKAYHGIGTKTIRSIVENYQGTVSFTVDDMFHVRVDTPM